MRVRVTPSRSADRGHRQEFRGSVIRSEGDTLVLSVHSAIGAVAIPVSWIESVDVSRGTESAGSAAWRSGQAGLLVGAVIGSTVGAELAAMGEESFLRAVPLRAVLYGLSAGLPAALLGALNPGERWERVPTRVLPTAVPGSDELSFGLKMVTRW